MLPWGFIERENKEKTIKKEKETIMYRVDTISAEDKLNDLKNKIYNSDKII
jgi:hypothetical protein